ncbi:hypothetical protein Tco_0582651, partial [Tanacetum coccineum]
MLDIDSYDKIMRRTFHIIGLFNITVETYTGVKAHPDVYYRGQFKVEVRGVQSFPTTTAWLYDAVSNDQADSATPLRYQTRTIGKSGSYIDESEQLNMVVTTSAIDDRPYGEAMDLVYLFHNLCIGCEQISCKLDKGCGLFTFGPLLPDALHMPGTGMQISRIDNETCKLDKCVADVKSPGERYHGTTYNKLMQMPTLRHIEAIQVKLTCSCCKRHWTCLIFSMVDSGPQVSS